MAEQIERLAPLNYMRLERPDGGWPVPYFRLPFEVMKGVIEGCDRIVIESRQRSSVVSLRKIISGGMRMPHLHVGEEIVLLNQSALQKYLHAAADEVAKIDDIMDIDEYIKY